MTLTRVLLLAGVFGLFACGGDDGGGPGGRTHRDTSGGDDVVADTTVDPCANGAKDGAETDVDCGGGCGPCAEGKICGAAADCASGFCAPGYVCGVAACANGTQDVGETGVDCGGPCPACLGGACNKDAECSSGYCKTGVCDTPTCSDGVKNGFETGTDCGGDCAQCPDGEGCVVDGHCLSGFCKAGHCATPTCSDALKNQNESDVDCGGVCAGCALGKLCAGGADCASGRCADGHCAEVQASCDDGQKNGGETDVDCGGACAGCGFGKACTLPADCVSGLCAEGACGAPASCNDGQKNGNESDADCGGACASCATGKYCGVHADCLSGTCIFGVCKEPTCADDVKNQDESDVDCGGGCPDCEDGLACKGNTDCASASCNGGVCISCADGQKNGGETDVDCGGGCDKCAVGKACGGKADCASGACEGGQCCTPNACGQCAATPAEICDGKDNDCDGQTDEAAQIGAPPACSKQSGVCAGSKAQCLGAQGWGCTDQTYLAFHGRYEKDELLCDGLDNDCDGQKDEPAACAVCSSTKLATLRTDSGSYGFYGMVAHAWIDTLDGDAYVITQRSSWDEGDPTDLTLYKLVNGSSVTSWKLGEGYDGLASVAAAEGKLHVGASTIVASQSFTYTNAMEYFQVSTTGSTLAHEDVVTADAESPSPAIVVPAMGTIFMGYFTNPNLDTHTLIRRLAPGQWGQSATLWGRGDDGFQLVITPGGQVYEMYEDTFHDIEMWDGDTGGSTGSASIAELSTEYAYTPVLRRDAKGRLHAAFREKPYNQNETTVRYRLNPSGSTHDWAGDEELDPAVALTMDLGPTGEPALAWITPERAVVVANLAGSAWDESTLTTLPADADVGSLFAMAIDRHERRHVVWAYGSDPGTVGYALTCRKGGFCTPNCADKACGPDGCGGSCGTCPAGTGCAGGACVSGEGCGGITFEGCCTGFVTKWCDNGVLQSKDCAGEPSCGWNSAESYYWCGTDGGSDPSGTNPKACP